MPPESSRVLHAVATPYRERSHFDAQNVLESGDCGRMARPAAGSTARSSALPAGKSREAGVALGANVPLAMRGPAEVASWSPTQIAALDDGNAGAHHDLYARDPLLSQRSGRRARERCDRERSAGAAAPRR
jgi:uncharacterized protein (DUF1501 family)